MKKVLLIVFCFSSLTTVFGQTDFEYVVAAENVFLHLSNKYCAEPYDTAQVVDLVNIFSEKTDSFALSEHLEYKLLHYQSEAISCKTRKINFVSNFLKEIRNNLVKGTEKKRCFDLVKNKTESLIFMPFVEIIELRELYKQCQSGY